jgi:hypothetical protein
VGSPACLTLRVAHVDGTQLEAAAFRPGRGELLEQDLRDEVLPTYLSCLHLPDSGKRLAHGANGLTPRRDGYAVRQHPVRRSGRPASPQGRLHALYPAGTGKGHVLLPARRSRVLVFSDQPLRQRRTHAAPALDVGASTLVRLVRP